MKEFKENVIKSWVTNIIGFVIIGVALHIMWEAKDITWEGTFLLLIGVVCFGLPDSIFDKILKILRIRKDET